MSALHLTWSKAEVMTPGAMGTILVLDQQRQLAAMERDWKQLGRKAEPSNPFLSWDWQQAWLQTQPEHITPLVVAAPFNDGTLAGLLPLQRTRWRGLRRVEFLGQQSGADDLDCLLHPQAPPGTALRLLAVGLLRSRWDLMRLEGAHPDGALASALRDPAAANLGWLTAEAGEWLPYLDLPSSFEAYLASRSSNFRSEVRRRRRAFWRRYPDAVLECAENERALAGAFKHLFRLHALRQAQKGHAGIFDDEAMRQFHLRAGIRLAAHGGARLYLLRTGNTVVAALYGFSATRRFLYFQSGFDPSFTELSPGVTLMGLVIEDCIRRGELGFEFLRGDERYKSRWSDQRRRNETWLGAGSAAGRMVLRARAWRRRLQGAGEEAQTCRP